MRIKLCMYGKDSAGDRRHAQDVMRDLAITYATACAHPMGDCWIFEGVAPATVPTELPKYVTVMSK